jgi:hypothetical protein
VEVFFCPLAQAGIDGEFGSAHGDESRDREISGEFHMKTVIACLNKPSKRGSAQPYLYVQPSLLSYKLIDRQRGLQLREECLEIVKFPSRSPRAEELLVSIASIGKSLVRSKREAYRSICLALTSSSMEISSRFISRGKCDRQKSVSPNRNQHG